jgi:DNA-directed RNA polymerase specialized sigma24 family protein
LSVSENKDNIDNIISEYINSIYRIALILTMDLSGASEVTEDVFYSYLLFYKKENTDIKHWLLKETYNISMNYFRTKPRKKMSEEKLKKANISVPITKPLLLFLKKPDKYKTIICYKSCDHLSDSECSKLLNVNAANMISHYNREIEKAFKDKGSNFSDVLFSIQPDSDLADQIKNTVLTKSEDKSFISKKHLTLLKHTFDKYVPVIAVALIALCVFSYYAVSVGLFTGKVYKSSNDILNETSVISDVSVISTSSEASQSDTSQNSLSSEASQDYSSFDKVDVDAVISQDLGYTEYNIKSVPQNAVALWNELLRINAVPNSIHLIDYKYEGTTLTLYFDQYLQAAITASATTTLITSICKTYSSMFPDVTDIVILSNNSSLTKDGKNIDISSCWNTDISITDVHNISYGD